MNQPFTSFHTFRQRYPIRPNDADTLLGSGSYGRVVKVEDQLETEWVAIKISEFKGNDTKSLKAEVELAKRVTRQANIARYDACYRLETDTSICDFAIMKYYPDGNLADLLKKQTLAPTQIHDITQGILLGLQHLHRHRIVHRDFKPANILISRDYTGRFIPKIADFGLSKLVNDDELDSSDFDLSDGRGTPSYKAPEQIEGNRVSFNLDLWAFGVILYEMLTGEKPFRADLRTGSEQSIRREIEKKIVTVELPARTDTIQEPYRSMIRRCLVYDIHERVRKEDELLDLLHAIPQRLAEARQCIANGQHGEAISLLEAILATRGQHTESETLLAECRQAWASHQQLQGTLAKAALLIENQDFEQAKAAYEQILQNVPTHSEAVRGLATCLEKLRPRPAPVAMPPAEATDVFDGRPAQEDVTDVYVDVAASVSPPKSVSQPQTVSVAKPEATVATVMPVVQATPSVVESRTILPIAPSPKKAGNRNAVALAALAAGSVLVYFALNKLPTNTADTTNTDSTTVITGPGSSTSIGTVGPPPKGGIQTPVDPIPALTKRVDLALAKARKAYRQGDFATATMLTASALQLDPTRRDVRHLYDLAASQKPADAPAEQPQTATVIPTPASSVPAPENTPDEAAIAEKTKKQQQQAEYDQLIDTGVKAIDNGNNKAKAIADFNRAAALANEHNLNTTKAEGAYSRYLTKANKIFDNDEFDGAKGWYKVAQSLRDTPEVRMRIKQCNNQ